MRIFSDTLTTNDLYEALPAGVLANITTKGGRNRRHSFEVTLYVLEKDELHRRYGNSGGYGSRDDVAATWDEWGLWIEKLFDLDPDALIGHYESYSHFLDQTDHARNVGRMYNKPESLNYRTHTAPWLD
jgi:hypothetical protein